MISAARTDLSGRKFRNDHSERVTILPERGPNLAGGGIDLSAPTVLAKGENGLASTPVLQGGALY